MEDSCLFEVDVGHGRARLRLMGSDCAFVALDLSPYCCGKQQLFDVVGRKHISSFINVVNVFCHFRFPLLRLC